jgi:hypothetical protein
MARLISVREVREGLYRAAGGPEGAGSGEASTALLGQWFHEAFAALIGTDPCLSLETELAESRDDVKEQAATLKRHVFRHLIGPRLPRYHSHLVDSTRELLAFWEAMGDLCLWLAVMRLDAACGRERLWIAGEEDLAWEFQEPRLDPCRALDRSGGRRRPPAAAGRVVRGRAETGPGSARGRPGSGVSLLHHAGSQRRSCLAAWFPGAREFHAAAEDTDLRPRGAGTRAALAESPDRPAGRCPARPAKR